MLTEVLVGGVSVATFDDKGALIHEMFRQYEINNWALAIAINPEKVMQSQVNAQLKSIIDRCTIRYPDGIGVVKAMEKKLKHKILRLPGCEIWELLMQQAGKRNLPVFLVGGKNEVINQTMDKLKEDYQTPIVGFSDGYFEDEERLIQQIKTSGAQIVTVAMGSPKQEQFIFKCRKQGVDAIFMGVGGTYDVYTGHVIRAPSIWRKLHLEWFYRLVCQPKRVFRQVNLLKFLGLYLFNKL